MSDVPHSQQFLHSPTRPAVPKLVQPGVFSNVFMLQQVNDEFVLDFATTLIQPHELVARVVVSQKGLATTIAALEEGLAQCELRFGLSVRTVGELARSREATELTATELDEPGQEVPREPDKGHTDRGVDMAKVYQGLVIPDERLVGVFADSVDVRFTSGEFCLDFVGNLYPHSVVVARVFLAAGRLPSLAATLRGGMNRFATERSTVMSKARNAANDDSL